MHKILEAGFSTGIWQVEFPYELDSFILIGCL